MRGIIRDLLLGFFILAGPVSVAAADQDIGASPTEFVKHFQTGVAMSVASGTNFDIGISSFSGAPTWYYCTTPGCTPVEVPATHLGTSRPLGNGLNITFSPTGAPLVVRLTSAAGAGNPSERQHFIKIQVTNTTGYDETRDYRIVVRDPLRLAFVLDRSGSMECGEGGDSVDDWANCRHCQLPAAGACSCALPSGACGRRWDKLVSAVDAFRFRLENDQSNLLLANDRFSLVYFSGTVLVEPDPAFDLQGLDSWADFATFNSRVINNMNATGIGAPILGRDGTSLGAGLSSMYKDRFGSEDTDYRQVALFFTDGEQNRIPLIRMKPDGTLWIDENGDGTIGPTDTQFSSFPNIEIFAIGVGPYPGTTGILADIASGPGNLYHVSPGMDADILDEMNVDAFNDIFNQASPQLIRSVFGALRSQDQAAFVCQKGATRLFFEAQFEEPVAHLFRFRIKRGTEEVTGMAESLTGPYSASFILDFSRLPELDSRGEWTFSYELQDPGAPAPSSRVNLSAIADDHATDLAYSLGKDNLQVGDRMKPSLTVTHNGQPVDNARVTALILKPGEDLGDLLARADESGFSLSDDPDSGPCGTQKYVFLRLNNPSALAAWDQVESSTVDLAHQGGGRYEGSYADLDVSGVYKVVFLLEADLPDVGTLIRTKEYTTNVRVGEINLQLNRKQTDVRKFVALPQEGGQTLAVSQQPATTTLSFRPAYLAGSRKRYVGPGLGYAFSVESNGPQPLQVVETCDGRYELTVPVSEEEKVNVYFLGQEVYQGKAGNFDEYYRKYKVGVSLHGGATFPFSGLENTYEGSFFIETDLGMWFSPSFSAELVGGYYAFRDDFHILGGTLYGQFQRNFVSVGNLTFRIAAGLGAYQPRNENTSVGFSGRFDLYRDFGLHWTIAGQAAYFNLPDPGYAFWTVGGSVKYWF